MFYDANLLETPPDWIDFLRMQNNEVCGCVCVGVCVGGWVKPYDRVSLVVFLINLLIYPRT